MSWYYDYKPVIETDEGIKAKSKRGAFVQNWWASRWIEAMEDVMDRGRLSRGRRYARRGQVLSLDEADGLVKAEVQGTRGRPYEISIDVKALTDRQWARVIDAMATRPIFLAQLLTGEMPQDIEEAFAEAKLSLFPASAKELDQHCNCPDWASVCKHLAAVHYILAERFDEDPFLLFRLRGRSQNELLDVLGQRGGLLREEGVDYDVPEYEPPPPLTEQVETFWASGDAAHHFPVEIEPPPEPYPALVRLGAPSFLEDIEQRLGPAYDVMSKTAVEYLLNEEATEMNGETDETVVDEAGDESP